MSAERPKPVKPKKDYKEIKRLRQEAKKIIVLMDDAPTIPEKEVEPKTYKDFKKEATPRKKVREAAKKFAEPSGAQAWEKRKGRGN